VDEHAIAFAPPVQRALHLIERYRFAIDLRECQAGRATFQQHITGGDAGVEVAAESSDTRRTVPRLQMQFFKFAAQTETLPLARPRGQLDVQVPQLAAR